VITLLIFFFVSVFSCGFSWIVRWFERVIGEMFLFLLSSPPGSCQLPAGLTVWEFKKAVGGAV
jgi:hypothetical protein